MHTCSRHSEGLCLHAHTHVPDTANVVCVSPSILSPLPSGSQGSQSQPVDDGSESTTIPSSQLRMEEESTALDGHASHLCIAALSRGICSRLSEHFKRDKEAMAKPSDAGAKAEAPGGSRSVTVTMAQEESRRTGEVSNPVLPPAPHPSDLATPASPHDHTSTVDELRSSLRQVADALAQTVAAVRNTRQQITSQGEGEGADTSEAREEGGERAPAGEFEARMETSDARVPSAPPRENLLASALAEAQQCLLPVFPVSLPPAFRPPLLPDAVPLQAPLLPPPSTTSSTTVTSASPSSLPILATFDGSQESARATLATANPEDPLYTFLHAVAGAPAPPLPSSVPSLSPAPTMSEGTSSPRLPVFAQFQSGSTSDAGSIPTSTAPFEAPQFLHAQSSSSAIHLPVIQDSRQSQAMSTGSTTTTTSSGSSRTGLPTIEPTHSSEALGSTLLPPLPQVMPSPVAAPTSPHSQSLPSSSEEVSSLAADLASQVSSFWSQSAGLTLPAPTSAETVPVASGDVAAQAASLADSLAQELVHAVSTLVSTTASSGPPSQAQSGVSVSSALPSTSVDALPDLTAPSSAVGRSATLQSPSPSDTLAPLLLQSLQMQPSVSADSLESGLATSSSATFTMDRSRSQLEGESGGDADPAHLQGVEVSASSSQQPGAHRGLTNTWSSFVGMSSSGARPAEPTTTFTSDERAQIQAALDRTIHMDTGQSSSQPRSDPASAAGPSGSAEAAASSEPAQDIDPTFLAALPESIRQEVIVQHERERLAQRMRQEAFQSAISSEFLSALPPNIQEEVWWCSLVCSVQVPHTCSTMLCICLP